MPRYRTRSIPVYGLLFLPVLTLLTAGACSRTTPASRNAQARSETMSQPSEPWQSPKCAAGPIGANEACRLYDPAVIELLLRPEPYVGKPVRLVGVLSLRFEDRALYASTEDYQMQITRNALWLSDDRGLDQYRSLQGKYVTVWGVVAQGGPGGHYGLFGGELRDIAGVEDRARWLELHEGLPRAVPYAAPRRP